MRTLSIICPAYNEAPNINPLYEEVVKVMRHWDNRWEIIFINDGSTDSTQTILEQLAQEDEHVIVIHLPENKGQSHATKQGIEAAKGEWITFLDADLQNDPADILKLVKKLEEGYDLVCGWRKKRKDRPFYKLPSRIGNQVIRALFNIQIHDIGCSSKIGYTAQFKQMEYLPNFHRYFPILLSKGNNKITEIEVHHRERLSGKSKYSTLKIIGALKEWIALKRKGY